MTSQNLHLSRRTVLAGAGAAAATGTLASGAWEPAEAVNRYFQHGVASGDPYPTSVVIWTRVTPTAASRPGSGAGPRVAVRWEVARDSKFVNVVKRGSFATTAARDHTVKLAPSGLKPGTWYFYRFSYKGVFSRVGRTRTAPAAASTPARVRFGVVSCANLQAGWFSAYRHLALRKDLHAILHLGDYLYEYAPGQYGMGQANADVRKHVPAHEIKTLADYRQRHAQYKQDTDLQRLHAFLPFITTWDDHESANDAYDKGAENHTEGAEGTWVERRDWSQRAYDEWMPTRLGGTAALDGGRLYRRMRFGQLAELTMLDLRSYRSKQAAQYESSVVDDPERTITGESQMDYLKASLNEARAQWKLIGNPVMIAPVLVPPLPTSITDHVTKKTGVLPADGAPYNADQWDGYTADRREVYAHIRDHGVQNTVFLTGDIHSAWACDLPVDAGSYPLLSDSVGTEFVTTSVTSNNLKDITGTPARTTSIAVEEAVKTANRHVKYLNFDDHGYSVLDITAERVQMDYYVIGDRAVRTTGSTWTQSWATTAGTHVVHPVGKPVA